MLMSALMTDITDGADHIGPQAGPKSPYSMVRFLKKCLKPYFFTNLELFNDSEFLAKKGLCQSGF